MSRIEWRHDGRRIFVPILVLRPTPTSDLTHIRVLALLDTGATSTGIARSVAVRLGLRERGKRPLISAQGIGSAERYVFRVGFALSSNDQLPTSFPYVFEEVLGFELVDGTELDAVLGMDILRLCDFTAQRDGLCSLAFG